METQCSLVKTPPAANDTPIRIAALDLDGTIIDGQSGAELVVYLIGRKMLNPLSIAKIGWWGVRYKLHLPCEQSEVREDIFAMFKNDKVENVVSMMKEFHDSRLIPLYRKDAIATINQLKKDGFYVMMVTASFLSCAMPVAENVGVDALLATRMELTADKSGYTGKVEGAPVEGQQKVIAITEFANSKFGEGAWVLERAYGDHYSDGPMLRAATQGFAVSPDTKLNKLARAERWPILNWK